MLISKFDTSNVEKHISEYEEMYSFKFPMQYRTFLLRYNGGHTPKTTFKIKGVSSDLRGFYGLGNADINCNFSKCKKEDIFNFLRDGKLPIASNVWGDHILLGVMEDDSNATYFLYHDKPKEYIKLSKDFKSFVEQCISEKIGYIPSIEERIKNQKAKGHQVSIEKIKGWQAELEKYINIHQEELVL